MRILEVRDGFIKFESLESVSLSAFIKVIDVEKQYLAQIVQVKKIGENFVAFAKLLFILAEKLLDYDKTVPSINSELELYSFDNIAKSFSVNEPLNVGFFVDNDLDIIVDKKSFNKETLICFENLENNKIVLSNLSKQYEHSIILDTLGVVSTDKFVAGVDFKLPLNTESLNFIFEDCLNDATSDSKNLIQEIFNDLSDYSKTVSFLPFNVLKSIVDNMVEKEHVFKLLVLKNKLTKFEKMGYFASTAEEATNLSKILNQPNVVIDLSKLESTFLNRYLEIILSIVKKEASDAQVFVEASNLINKKNLKTILKDDLSTTFITHSRFKYINEIKQLFSNFIIEPSFITNTIFKSYSLFLKSMNNDTYLVVGENTNSIPLVSKFEELKLLPRVETESEENEIIEENNLVNNDEIITDAEELEEALIIDDLNNDLDDSTITEEQSLNAIEKKSNTIIEKVSEEIAEQVGENIDIFSDENEELNNIDTDSNIVAEYSLEDELATSNEPEEVVTSLEEDLNNKDTDVEIEINSEVVETIELDNSIQSFSDEAEEFHTRVDDFKAIDVPEGISELTEEQEEPILDEIEQIDDDLSIENEVEEVDNDNVVIDEIESIEITESLEEIIEETQDDLELVESSDFIEEATLEEIQEFEAESVNEEIQENTEAFVVDDDFEGEIDEIVELDDTEILDSDIIVDLEDAEESNAEADLDKAIVEDVDKVFTTMKDDSISDSDLDFIDELNGNLEEEEVILEEGFEELTDFAELEGQDDDSFLEPLEEVGNLTQEDEPEDKEILETKKASTPIVPVYGAEIPTEDIVVSDSVEQGDSVTHAKYGNGVVEKMIKYGTKTLYSINFDNIGRRLLDPTLTEIKKI